jgi:two-component system cell cycle response regulator
VNDTHGHDAGDEALRRVANVIQSGTRGIDTGARIGGDEFAVILPETDLARGLEVAERLRSAIAALDFGPAGRITASLGVAELPACARTGEELRAAADAALYDAKRGGRDRAASAPVQENPAPALGVS